MTAKRVHMSDEYDYNASINNDLNIAVAVTNDQIGERGWLNNHNKFGEWGREQALELFERDIDWLLSYSYVLRAKFMSMKDARIACTCPDHMDCHADVIVDKINNL